MAAWRRLTHIRHLSGPPRRTMNWSAAGAELADPATLRGRQDQLAAEPDGARRTCENSRTVSLLMAGILAPPYFHTFTAGVVPYLHYTICVNCPRRRHRTLLTGASRSLARAGRGAGHAGLARRPVPWAFVDLHPDFGVPVDRLAISLPTVATGRRTVSHAVLGPASGLAGHICHRLARPPSGSRKRCRTGYLRASCRATPQASSSDNGRATRVNRRPVGEKPGTLHGVTCTIPVFRRRFTLPDRLHAPKYARPPSTTPCTAAETGVPSRLNAVSSMPLAGARGARSHRSGLLPLVPLGNGRGPLRRRDGGPYAPSSPGPASEVARRRYAGCAAGTASGAAGASQRQDLPPRPAM